MPVESGDSFPPARNLYRARNRALREIKKWLSTQGCRRNDVSAVRRKVMCRRVRLTLPHSNATITGGLFGESFSGPKRCEDASHSKGTSCEIDGSAYGRGGG